MIRSGKQKLLLILCAAFIVRLFQLFTVFAISGDGPVYIEMARNFYVGNLKAGLARDYPPLYPLLITGVYSITRDWVVAGWLVSFVCGILTILPIYYLARDVFGEKVAEVTAVLSAFYPALSQYSVVVLSQSVYVFLFMMTVWLGWKAITNNSKRMYFLTGLLSGLNYLARPEGLGIVIVMALYTFSTGFSSFKNTYKKKIILITIMCMGVFIFVAPYVLYVKGETGEWRLSKKKSIITAITGSEDVTTPDNTGSYYLRIPCYSKLEGGYIKMLIEMSILFVRIYIPVLFLLMLFGLMSRKIIPWSLGYEIFIGIIILFHILVFSLFYLSERQLMPLAAASLFWAAIGFNELHNLIITKVVWARERVKKNQGKIFWILLTAVILTLLPYTFRPQDRDKIGQRKVGEWMKENCGENSYILTDMSRAAFYAGGYFVPLQNRLNIDKYEDLIKFAKTPNEGSYNYNSGRSHSIDYIVIDKSRIANCCPDFLDSVDSAILEEIHVQPKLEHSTYGEIVVYKVK
ncbi:MAG: glycosyltransferase family 39 protein [Phycisphaerae bacterium]|jgi:4-amino-4-deoxy-L-arabinose transferase-like glycosyltransferase